MKRLILALLLFVPLGQVVWAGTDDSGLKVMQVRGTEMYGFSDALDSEDTKFALGAGFSSYVTNCYTGMGGLCAQAVPTFAYTYDTGSVTLWDARLPTDQEFGATFLMQRNGSDWYVRNRDGSGNFEIIPHWYAGQHYLYVFSAFYDSKEYNYVMNGDEMWKYEKGTTTPERVFGTQWDGETVVSASVWQNRLFVAEQDVIWYSSAATGEFPEDFTQAVGYGGQLTVGNTGNITRLITTQYGLYIFTTTGIHLLSGIGLPDDGWRVEQISDFVIENSYDANVGAAFEYNNRVFCCNRDDVFELSGTTLTKICTLPKGNLLVNFTVHNITFAKDRFLVISGRGTGAMEVFAYDTQTNSFCKWDWAKVCFSGNFYGTEDDGDIDISWIPGMNYLAQGNSQCVGFDYRSSWMTLDGNPGVHKEIVRIEIDVLSGEDDTNEVRLYYQDASGESYETTSFAGNDSYKTHVWNVGLDVPVRRIALYIANDSTAVQAPCVVKAFRVYYRTLGDYKGGGPI